MTSRIHIKIADRGWILEKCASEIARRASNISYDTASDPTADIQYYINYSARRERVSPIELALFTHLEKDKTAAARFFHVAHELDHVVCMSQKYADLLVKDGVTSVNVIAPGVDTDAFRPKVRVGVVGRTYHTGRKGEALVAEVMETPGIEWRFTGSGWPGPSAHVPDGAMPEFYNDLDYVLVPALYEGGPMCVLEGLACGVPIITSDVGWAQEYPHIPFENGDAASLRRVLTGLVEEREKLRQAVLHKTWDAWAEENLALLDRIAAAKSTATSGGLQLSTPDVARNGVLLLTHGGEEKTLGGPSVRVPRTAAELRSLGVQANLAAAAPGDCIAHELIHIFNVWPVESCLNAVSRAKFVGKRVALSPIYLNLAHLETFGHAIPDLFRNNRGGRSLDIALRSIAEDVAAEPNLPIREPFLGYHAKVRACLDAADRLICLSDYERACLEHLGAAGERISIVRNGVDGKRFYAADPELFAKKYNLQGYVLCVGRIEPRKNQLILAHAAKRLGRKLVLVGHAGNEAYASQVRETGGDNVLIIPRIDNEDPALASAFSGADVFCLPSWSEGAPLAALEAAAAGAPMVLSDRSSEREYFGDDARYVNPADIDGLCEAIESAASSRSDEARAMRQKDRMRSDFSWRQYAADTLEAYHEIRPAAIDARAGSVNATPGKIYFDLTTTAHFTGNPTGIARVEDRAYRAAVEIARDRITPIAWNSRTRNFLKLRLSDSLGRITLDKIDKWEKSGRATIIEKGTLSDGGRIIVVGGAWIRNQSYVAAFRRLKISSNVALTVLIHDLIQMKLCHMYPAGAGDEFTANATRLTSIADDFLVYSDTSRNDLSEFLFSTGQFFKPINKFRIGDMSDFGETGDSKILCPKSILTFEGQKFILYVSSIDVRKNHMLLINVWRRLIEERGANAPHLVLVGRTLWRGEEIVDIINRELRLAQHVHLLQDVGDVELHWLYENCQLTVYPSLYEGWGLPVAESLCYGKPCIVANRSSTKEIAPQLTDNLDPFDFRAWIDKISLYLDNPAFLANKAIRIKEAFKTVDWTESLTQILAAVDPLSHGQPVFAGIAPATGIDFSSSATALTADQLCLEGWAAAERAGRWTIGPKAALGFTYLGRNDSICVRMKLYALTRSAGERRKATLRVRGGRSQEFEISGTPEEIDFTLQLPSSADNALQSIELSIEFDTLLSPWDVDGRNDRRPLGIFVMSMVFADRKEELDIKVASATKNRETPVDSAPIATGRVTVSMQERLALALDRTYTPVRLPNTKPIYKLLRLLWLDKVGLAIYNKIFGRTNDSIRRVIDVIQNPQSDGR